MQADLSARVALPAGFSLEAVGGLRGQVREPDLLVPIQNYQPVSTSQLISREHYLMWEPEAVGPYLRVGRFFAPYGLRMAEHILYINRDLGFDELEETYNVSGGFVYPNAELHLTAVRARLRPAHRQRRERLRRLPGDALPRGHHRAGRSDARGGRAGRDQADGRRRRQRATSKACTRCCSARSTSSTTSSPISAIRSRAQLVGAAGFTLFPVPRSHDHRCSASAIRSTSAVDDA